MPSTEAEILPSKSWTLYLRGGETKVIWYRERVFSDLDEQQFLTEHPEFQWEIQGELWDAMIPWMDAMTYPTPRALGR